MSPIVARSLQLQIGPSPGIVWISWQALSFLANTSRVLVILFKTFWVVCACVTMSTRLSLSSSGKAAWLSIRSLNWAFLLIPFDIFNPQAWQIPFKDTMVCLYCLIYCSRSVVKLAYFCCSISLALIVLSCVSWARKARAWASFKSVFGLNNDFQRSSVHSCRR